jgi:hypothetical protein
LYCSAALQQTAAAELPDTKRLFAKTGSGQTKRKQAKFK